MVLVFGQRPFGRVERFAGTAVETRFFHACHLPLVPLGSWLVRPPEAAGRVRSTRLGWHPGSIAAGYLRTWGPLLAAWGLIACAATPLGGASPAFVRPVVWTVAFVALAAWAHLAVGRLSQAAKAQRVVYFDATGTFADAAHLGLAHAALKISLRAQVGRAAQRSMSASYREAAPAVAATIAGDDRWVVHATAPDCRERALLRSALTLARVEWSLARGASRRRWARAHAAIFTNLGAADPEVLHPSRFERAG